MRKKELTYHDFVEDVSLMKQWHKELIDNRGGMRTTSLFWEVRRDRSEDPNLDPIFTLKSRDHIVNGVKYYSLKQIYLSYDHVPGYEYQFAIDVFNSWDHWVKLTKSSIRGEFEEWRKELDVRIKALMMKNLLQASRTDDAKGVTASRYIADKGYEKQGARGRPSKTEVEGELKRQVADRETLYKDMERLGISVAK